ncbi:MAG: Thiamin-phosphate pyrophosphorylase [Pseudomonadota bacterium]
MKGLYLVTPDWDDTDKLLQTTGQAIKGGAVLIQYRHKSASAALRSEQAQALLRLCRQHGKPLIINDHVDLCLDLDADGVHVGGTDDSVAAVRARVGLDKIVGASCYGDLNLARDAAASGASYVAFGGFYPSRVKKYAVTTPPTMVADASHELTVPVCVIGGMTAANSQPLVQLGAYWVAAISSVYSADDPQTAAQEFTALFR